MKRRVEGGKVLVCDECGESTRVYRHGEQDYMMADMVEQGWTLVRVARRTWQCRCPGCSLVPERTVDPHRAVDDGVLSENIITLAGRVPY